MKFISDLKRSHYCGELGLKDKGAQVVLMGWVDTRRDHGGLVFVDLRDRSGLVQVVLNPLEKEMLSAKDFRNEYVVAIQGHVQQRPKGMENNALSTGKIEVVASRCEVLSSASPMPFPVGGDNVSESLRLKYRYLDLRSPRLQNFIKTRHKVAQLIRENLSEQGFLEVETPILYKSTPEGARDYLVPSRVFQGEFYALPQSPQTLKQLLMIAGYDKYFQIARCFRDEDLRADRQPEFSQIDVEMSFVDIDDVVASTEQLLRHLWKQVKGVELPQIPQMTYQEAMNRFGIDRPDLRIPWELKDLNEFLGDSGFKVFDDVLVRGGSIKGLAVPGIGSYSRSQFDKLTNLAKQMEAKGLVWIKDDGSGKLSSPVAKFFSEEKLKDLFIQADGESGGAVLIVADDFEITCAALAQLRVHLAKELKAIDTSKDSFVWVSNFPLFAYSPAEGRWQSVHHPFTAPKDEDLEKLKSGGSEALREAKAKAYDLV